MNNAEVAQVFENIADLLEIKGEKVFKVIAYRRGAEAIRTQGRDINAIWNDSALEEIPGVGKAIAEKTDELLGKNGDGPEGLPFSIIVTPDGTEGEVPILGGNGHVEVGPPEEASVEGEQSTEPEEMNGNEKLTAMGKSKAAGSKKSTGKKKAVSRSAKTKKSTKRRKK